MADSRSKLVARAEALPEDRSVVLHSFSDGWTLRELALYSDLVREGELMSNCLTHTSDIRHEIWDYHNVDDGGEPLEPDDERYIAHADFEHDTIPEDHRFVSLRDPDNIPRLTFQIMETDMCNVLGRHNSEPKWEYVERLQNWLEQDPSVEIDRYYDYGEGHPNPWRPTPIDEWFQHHYDFAFKVGAFSYQARPEQPVPTSELQARIAAAVDWWAQLIDEDVRTDEDQLEWFREALTASLTRHLTLEPNDEILLSPGRPPGDHLGRALGAGNLGGVRMALNGNQMLLSANSCQVKIEGEPFTPIAGTLPQQVLLSPIDQSPAPQRASARPELAGIEI